MDMPIQNLLYAVPACGALALIYAAVTTAWNTKQDAGTDRMKGIAEQTITWDDDSDFGYQVASAVPEFDDDELLQPRRLYEREGRLDEYVATVERLKNERVAHLQEFPELSEEIIKAVG